MFSPEIHIKAATHPMIGETMKHKDLLLISNLRANARATLTKISKDTRIPVSTIFDRLKMHERTIIKKHTAIVDFARLGFSTRATFTLKVAKQDKLRIKEHLLKHQNVNSIYKINNGFDYLIEGVFKNIKEMEEFIENMEEEFKIKSKQVFYIVEDIKREDFLANPHVIDVLCAEAEN